VLNAHQFPKTTFPMTRPAHARNEGELGKAVIAKDGSKIEKAVKAADALKTPRANTPTPSNQAKKLTKRGNQSRVAKGLKPQARYEAKNR
jgi:hypothetical protein